MTTISPSTPPRHTAQLLKRLQRRRTLLELHPLPAEQKAPSNLQHLPVVVLQAPTSQELHLQLLQRMLSPMQVPCNVSLARAVAIRHSRAPHGVP
jgi:hypothetical protein